MSGSDSLIHAMLDETLLSLDELCRATAVSPRWVHERMLDGLLSGTGGEAPAGPPTQWRFDSVTVRRVQRMVRVERDFDALPELAALVADLHDEIDRLRARLQRQGVT